MFGVRVMVSQVVTMQVAYAVWCGDGDGGAQINLYVKWREKAANGLGVRRALCARYVDLIRFANEKKKHIFSLLTR